LLKAAALQQLRELTGAGGIDHLLATGEPRVTDLEAVAIWRTIEILTDGEGDAVSVLSPNPDFNGQPNYAIDCCGHWTAWENRRFAADTQIECFLLALQAFRVADV
jgi:hypothetical protein